jgi:hypothetical protein
MKARLRRATDFASALMLVLTMSSLAAHADGDLWASRPGSTLVGASDSYEEYPGRMTTRNSSLQAYWESQREAQRDTGRSQSHAWYGLYGPYYAGTTQQRSTFGPGGYFAPISPYSPIVPNGLRHGVDCHSSFLECDDGLCDSSLFLDSLDGLCH